MGERIRAMTSVDLGAELRSEVDQELMRQPRSVTLRNVICEGLRRWLSEMASARESGHPSAQGVKPPAPKKRRVRERKPRPQNRGKAKKGDSNGDGKTEEG